MELVKHSTQPGSIHVGTGQSGDDPLVPDTTFSPSQRRPEANRLASLRQYCPFNKGMAAFRALEKMNARLHHPGVHTGASAKFQDS